MFKSDYQKLIYKISYARWNEDKIRREEGEETVYRYKNFMINRIKDKDARKEFEIAYDFV